MSNNFNLIVIGKKDLRARKIVMTDVDLVKDRHQQFGLIGKEILHLNNQLPVKFHIGMIDVAPKIQVNAKHAKIFRNLLNGLEYDLFIVQMRPDVTGSDIRKIAHGLNLN